MSNRLDNGEKLTGKLRQPGADGQPPAHAHTPHGDAQRQALTLVAFHLIAEGGLERFRTREVAKRAGVNIATLHYYFPSKEDLIRSVVDYLANEFATRRPVVEPADNPLLELRHELTDSLYQLREAPEIFTALFELFTRAAHDPVIREMMEAMDNHWHEHVVSYISAGVRQGEFRADLDPAVGAWELIAIIKGCVLQLTVHPTDFPIDRIHADVERWFVRSSVQA